MFEKFESANAADFRQRYQGTFGFFVEPGKPRMLCKLSFVDGITSFVDRRGNEYKLAPDRPDETGFLFLPPKAGYFNTDEGAVYVERTAARQFVRGICDRNTKMYLVGEKGFATVPVHFKYLEKVYENKVVFKDTLEQYLSGKIPSIALGSQFAINGKRVYVFSSDAGTVVEQSKEVIKLKLNDPSLFKTEINDALRGYIKLEVV